MACLCPQVTHSYCGTVEYMAPEIVQGGEGGHDMAVDWWSLGVLLFELLTCESPFAPSGEDNSQKDISRYLPLPCQPNLLPKLPPLPTSPPPPHLLLHLTSSLTSPPPHLPSSSSPLLLHLSSSPTSSPPPMSHSVHSRTTF